MSFIHGASTGGSPSLLSAAATTTVCTRLSSVAPPPSRGAPVDPQRWLSFPRRALLRKKAGDEGKEERNVRRRSDNAGSGEGGMADVDRIQQDHRNALRKEAFAEGAPGAPQERLVGQDHIGHRLLQGGQGVAAADGPTNQIALGLEDDGEEVNQGAIVIHDKDRRTRRRLHPIAVARTANRRLSPAHLASSTAVAAKSPAASSSVSACRARRWRSNMLRATSSSWQTCG